MMVESQTKNAIFFLYKGHFDESYLLKYIIIYMETNQLLVDTGWRSRTTRRHAIRSLDAVGR